MTEDIKPAGVWGLCGRDASIIHFCRDGKALCRKHPLLKFALPHWVAENEQSCPVCKKYYRALLAEQVGLAKLKESTDLS
jgi:queuine/archaeosine tRNA-ribosyltransferase